MTLWVALRYEHCDLFVLGYCCKYSMKFIKEKVNKTFKLLFYSEKKVIFFLSLGTISSLQCIIIIYYFNYFNCFVCTYSCITHFEMNVSLLFLFGYQPSKDLKGQNISYRFGTNMFNFHRSELQNTCHF